MDGKFCKAALDCMWYTVMLYVHNPDSVQKTIQTRLKKEMVLLENLPWIHWILENGCGFEGQRKEI